VRKWFQITLAVLVIVAALMGLLWCVSDWRDPYFHGQRQSAWINELGIWNGARWQSINQLKAFRAESVPVLVKGLRRQKDPWYGIYYKFRFQLPLALRSRIPSPISGVDVRTTAAMVLGDMGTNAAAALPALAQTMHDEDFGVRMAAGNSINTLLPLVGNEKLAILPSLIQAATDKAPGLRYLALKAVQNYPERSDVVMPVVLNALGDPDSHVRVTAVESLMKMDAATGSRTEVAELKKLLDDGDDEVRKAAKLALEGKRYRP
jgi:HEAT repeat protein